MTLSGQIIGATLGLVVTVSAAIAYMVGDLATNQLRGRIGASLADLATEMANRLDREMAVRIAEVDVLANLPGLGGRPDLGTARPVIGHLQRAMPEFSWVGILNDRGVVMAGTGGILEGVDISHRPVFQEGSKGRFVGDVHDAVMLASLLDNPSGEPIKFVDIAQPILDDSGAVAGVFAAHLSWTWARSVERALLRDRGSHKGVELYVVARDATILLGPDVSLHGQSVALNSVGAATAGKAGWIVETWADGNAYLTGYAHADGHGEFEGLGWIVLARQPVSAAFGPIDDLILRIVEIGAVLAALAAAVGWFLTRRIAGPVNLLSQAAVALRRDQRAGFPKVRGPREIEVLSDAFADLIESLIAKQHALDDITDKAHRDPLTGLANRAGLDRFIDLRQTTETPYAVLAIDLDGFKPVNDTHGHAAGDRVLQAVAERLRGCVRVGDMLVRVGGDEFLAFLVMLDTDRDGPARRVAKRVVKALGEPIEVSGPDGTVMATVRIGASVGVACYPRDARSLERAVMLADGASYEAKRAGKGRAVVHGSAVANAAE